MVELKASIKRKDLVVYFFFFTIVLNFISVSQIAGIFGSAIYLKIIILISCAIMFFFSISHYTFRALGIKLFIFFSITIIFHSIFFSPAPVYSLIKLSIWTFIIISLWGFFIHDHDTRKIKYILDISCLGFIAFSSVIFLFGYGYWTNKNDFQGFVIHPQSFGLLSYCFFYFLLFTGRGFYRVFGCGLLIFFIYISNSITSIILSVLAGIIFVSSRMDFPYRVLFRSAMFLFFFIGSLFFSSEIIENLPYERIELLSDLILRTSQYFPFGVGFGLGGMPADVEFYGMHLLGRTSEELQNSAVAIVLETGLIGSLFIVIGCLVLTFYLLLSRLHGLEFFVLFIVGCLVESLFFSIYGVAFWFWLFALYFASGKFPKVNEL